MEYKLFWWFHFNSASLGCCSMSPTLTDYYEFNMYQQITNKGSVNENVISRSYRKEEVIYVTVLYTSYFHTTKFYKHVTIYKPVSCIILLFHYLLNLEFILIYQNLEFIRSIKFIVNLILTALYGFIIKIIN